MRRQVAMALVLVACAAMAAGAATAAPTPAQLQRQIKALQRQVNALQRTVAALTRGAETEAQCESVIPVASYGGVSNEGYLYGVGEEVFLTSALDVVPDTTGVDPDLYAWMLVVDNACVSSSSTRPEAGLYRPRPAALMHRWEKRAA